MGYIRINICNFCCPGINPCQKGLEGINSNLATIIRTFVVLIAAWGIVFLTGKHKEITNLTSKNWRFLIYSWFSHRCLLGLFILGPYSLGSIKSCPY